jgi:hypothetical protein
VTKTSHIRDDARVLRDEFIAMLSRMKESQFQMIGECIRLIRGQTVLLDVDLARLYEVETKVLVQAVKRNSERFPADFMFQLDSIEFDILRSQSVTSRLKLPAQDEILRSQNHRERGWGGRRTPPFAFTEQGVAMLSSVLRSPRAIAVNVEIMRTVVRMRQMLASSDELTRRLDELEQRYDGQFTAVFEAIRQLMQPPPIKRHPLGF